MLESMLIHDYKRVHACIYVRSVYIFYRYKYGLPVMEFMYIVNS